MTGFRRIRGLGTNISRKYSLLFEKKNNNNDGGPLWNEKGNDFFFYETAVPDIEFVSGFGLEKIKDSDSGRSNPDPVIIRLNPKPCT